MKNSTLLRIAATLALAALVAFPAAAQQADFTTYVAIGDSLTAGYTDNCLVEYQQRDSFGALIARSAGATFEQPLIKAPGLGGCLVLTSLAPTLANRPSTGVPINSTLARPYNNLGIPGFRIVDVVDANPTTPAGGIAFPILRGQGTMLQQAAALKPSFVTILIGNNDVLNAMSSATAVEGLTLTPMAVINPKLDTIFSTLKAAQGGTGKGIVLTVVDVTSVAFVNTVSPILGTYPANVPVVGGQPIYALSTAGCTSTTGPVCPVPAGSLLTLLAAGYLQAGVGIPCAILPPTDPKQANCNKPLPDNLSVSATGVITPGVVLTPTEVAAIRARTADINAALTAKGTAAGYKIFDVGAFFSDVIAHGRTFAGMIVTTAYLSGGFFGYDGTHPTTLGYAILARDVIKFINANYGNNLPDVNMYAILFNGNTSPGGFPIGLAQSPAEQLQWAAEIFGPDNWQENLKYVFPDLTRHRVVSGSPEGEPVNGAREMPVRDVDRVH